MDEPERVVAGEVYAATLCSAAPCPPCAAPGDSLFSLISFPERDEEDWNDRSFSPSVRPERTITAPDGEGDDNGDDKADVIDRFIDVRVTEGD